jgi:NADH dehydrogenase
VGDVREAVIGCDAVVHLVAIIVERGDQTFMSVNVGGTEGVIDAMTSAGIRRLVHVSALGAGPDERFGYLRSKWIAEEAVRRSGLDATILRPSVVFGPGAGFFRPIVWSLRWMPVYPMVNQGVTPLQPIFVEDLCRCIDACLRDDSHIGQTYELGGPEVITFGGLVDLTARTLGKRRRKVNVPTWTARPFALVNRLVRDPIVTSEQLDMVVLDNTCETDGVKRTFGFEPRRIGETDLRWLALL